MVEINIVVCAYDKTSAIPDGLVYKCYNDLLKESENDKTSTVKTVVVSGYVLMMLLIAKDYKKEIKIHQITELNELGNIEAIHNRIDGNWNIENIKSLNVLENILWEML